LEQSRSDEFGEGGTADYFFEADEDAAVIGSGTLPKRAYICS
jgi:hypothetical protein